jgi:hypothetical protein
LVAEILSPANACFQVLEAAPLPSSPHPEKQNENRGVRKLAIHLNATEIRLAVVFSATGPASPMKVSALAEW